MKIRPSASICPQMDKENLRTTTSKKLNLFHNITNTEAELNPSINC
jgi:hypothetical protein